MNQDTNSATGGAGDNSSSSATRGNATGGKAVSGSVSYKDPQP